MIKAHDSPWFYCVQSIRTIFINQNEGRSFCIQNCILSEKQRPQKVRFLV